MTTLLDLFRSQQSFLLTGHENPDGDCVGAQVALSQLLLSMGKTVHIVNPDPLSKSYEFLAEHTSFGTAKNEADLPEFDVAVLLDCSQLSRVGALGKSIAARNKTIAVIDHHVGCENGDGSVSYVDPTAAATGALVRRLYADFGAELTMPAAQGIFLSLVSDTGWFRYSNSDAEVFAMASELVALGVDSSQVYDAINRRNHPSSPQLLSDALEESELLLDGRMARISLGKSLLERCSRLNFDTDLIMEPLRSVEGVEVVALLKERFDGIIKCSLRARGDVDVQAIVKLFGGGGHKKAAGASLAMSLTEAESAIEAAVKQALAAQAENQ